MKIKAHASWLITPLLLGVTMAWADENVRMYGHGEVPEASDVAHILGGKAPKMRGISLNSAYQPKDKMKQSLDEIAKPQTTVVGVPVEFAFNSAEILPNSEPQLAAIAEGIKMTNGVSVVVEGHTDAYGSSTYNKNLSLMRAKAVKQHLVQKYRISSTQLVIKGLGESSPLSSNTPFASENRRVQFRAAE